MKKNQEEMNIADNPLYHDTWKLLKKYRDVVWSLELSVQQVRSRFEIEYGSSIEDFLESVYVAGIDLSDRSIEHQEPPDAETFGYLHRPAPYQA